MTIEDFRELVKQLFDLSLTSDVVRKRKVTGLVQDMVDETKNYSTTESKRGYYRIVDLVYMKYRVFSL